MTPNTFVLSDPAFAPLLATLRDRSLRPAAVRATVSAMTSLLAQEAATTPVAPGEKVAVIVILRSGLAMSDAFTAALPADADTVVYHLGLFREKHTLQPVEYYNKLPRKPQNIKHAYVLDPLVATGGTARAAINILKDWGIESVTFACLLASQAGLEAATSAWPENTRFVVGHVDSSLDDKGYVQPGVGDIGDRLFGTTE
ncbi:hypothetical protein TD95_003506 [Thielaviopsis punctulata]|uniref:uracil phosphoribosyltransferase n=1 Tax=Thielaviopsis punctulata TaxID=72032 RepID=A0A0F4ZIV0_9PEZI|nr:hypothetical protein TD95_004811 [Thielaviopsis punctulata]KKA30738.1 hypothetical protein TD95_003506 [Thielaviopsis punctulata]